MWLLYVLLLILLTVILHRLNKTYFILTLSRRVKTIDGSKLEDKITIIPGKTIFGNNFDLLHMNPETIFQYMLTNSQITKGKHFLLYFLYAPAYFIINADDAEELFQSQTLITKGVMYELVKPFLGDGLLISTDQKWHSRRKLLTPAFHFNVLQSFNEIFKEESIKLLKRLKTLKSNKLDVADVISEFTLNNICETALGVKLDDFHGSAEYRKSIHFIEEIIVKRMFNPLMYYLPVFYLFGKYKEHKKYLKIAHDFSSKIIQKKREAFERTKRNATATVEDIDEFGRKKRYAMLDTLLEEEFRGNITHEGICDEVNTFMFEGYDTTSTCLKFTIFNLALHPEIQEKCRQELEELTDFSSLTVFDFNKLEYLECVLKETLRMYPSVPFFSRACTTETKLNGLIFPANAQINISTYCIQRDPKYYEDPNVFKPERFLPEFTTNRHPFAFVPFSAGSRNCIGQKFAILEMKAVMVIILKNFRILPVTTLEELTFENGLILRTRENIYVKLEEI